MADPATPIRDIGHYDTGALRYRGFKLDGEMHGDWEFMRKNGSVMRTGQFDRGRQVGVWTTFDRAGSVVTLKDLGDGGPARS